MKKGQKLERMIEMQSTGKKLIFTGGESIEELNENQN